MKKLAFLPLVLLTASCLPESEKKQILVDGEAEIEVPADSFRMNATLRTRAGASANVISELSSKLEAFTVELPKLEGLATLEIEPSGLELRPVLDFECENVRGYETEKSCPVTGYYTEVKVEIDGSPAEVAGNVFSLATELGAEEIEFGEYYLSDRVSAEKEVERKAFEVAKNKAQRLAASANVTLLSPLSISDLGSRGVAIGISRGIVGEVRTVSGFSREPETILSITPPPIKVEKQVRVVFEIE